MTQNLFTIGRCHYSLYFEAFEAGYTQGSFNATRHLERFSAPCPRVVPDLSVPGDDANEIHSPTPCGNRPPLPSARQAGRIEIEIGGAPTDQHRSERSLMRRTLVRTSAPIQNRPPEPIKAAQPLGLRL